MTSVAGCFRLLIRSATFFAVFAISVLFAPAENANAQLNTILGGVEPRTGGYPSQEYYLALEIYRTAELDRAIDAFEFALRRTRRDINGHWVDAIPVYAMMAECQYKLGDLEGAMQSLDVALKIAVRYRGWLQRPVWQEVLRTQVKFSPKQFLWPEANAVNRLPIADQVKYYSGEQLTEQRFAQGGRIEELNIKAVDVAEIMRGLAIASYRRRIILGPLAEGDGLANQLLDSTKYPAGLQLPIAMNLIGAMRAAERFGAFQDERAVSDTAKNALFNGGVHPLSPITMLCAASAMAASEKPAAAIPMCLAITNQADSMEHYEWTGEALQLAAGCAGPNEAAAVQQAGQLVATSLIRKSRLAALHCLIASADAAVTAGDLPSAVARLNEARSLAARRDVIQPRLETYIEYVTARLATRGVTRDNTAAGGSARAAIKPWSDSVQRMVAFATSNRLKNRNLISMPRLYQLQRVRLALGRDLNGQSADVLLSRYCDDPTIDVWRRDPVDAIAGVIADRDSLRLSRLRTAASRDSALDVLMRIEDLQAGRVRSQFALGGRVMQVRAFSGMPDNLLSKKTIELRNLAAKPVRDLRSAVTAAEVAVPKAAAPVDPGAAMTDAKLDQLETMAWMIALDRHDIPIAMPHPLDEKQPVAELPAKTAILAFFQDTNLLHVVLCTKQKSTYWSVKGTSRLGGEISKVLKGIGASASRGARLPKDSTWREDATALRDRLILPGTGPLLQGRLAGIEQLVVIPDSMLWYLPMEVLPTAEAGSALLGDELDLVYAATPSLAMFPTGPKSLTPNLAITAGQFFAPRDQDQNRAKVQSILDSVGAGAVFRLPMDRKVPTCRSGEFAGHLLVAEPMTPNPKSTLDSPLASYETSANAGRLRAWVGYPYQKPSSVFLGGFRSNIDTNRGTSGNEIMLTIATLQYAGVRDVVLSRWAVGGESSALLMREYVQELPFLGPAKALARAKSVLRRSDLDPAAEPTLTSSDQERDSLNGNEPLFWSGYLHASPIEP